MRWTWVALASALMTTGLRGQSPPEPTALVVIDRGHASPDDQARLGELAQAIPGADVREWHGFGVDPATKHQLSFADALDIVRGNASSLQAIRDRECIAMTPGCGVDLPVRARQSLDNFDALASATLDNLATMIGAGSGPPTSVAFVTTGLPYRTEPRRAMEAVRDRLRHTKATLIVLDAGSVDAGRRGLDRLIEITGGDRVNADRDGLERLRARVATVVAKDLERAAATPPAGPARRLPPDLQVASRHAVAFAAIAETLLAEEHYVQEVKSRTSHTALPIDSPAGITVEARVLDSEVALVQIASGEIWLLARDVQRVDGRPVEPSQRVPLPAVRAGSEAEALTQFRAIAAQGARFNIGGIRRDLNVPTLALWLLTPAINQRFDYSAGGTETVEGRAADVTRFRERKAPYLFNVDGVPTPVAGRFWLDRSRGAVVKTEMVLQSNRAGQNSSRARLVVTYAFDPRVEAWVPRTMTEQYNTQGTPQFVVGNSAYTNFRKFSTSGRIVK